MTKRLRRFRKVIEDGHVLYYLRRPIGNAHIQVGVMVPLHEIELARPRVARRLLQARQELLQAARAYP